VGVWVQIKNNVTNYVHVLDGMSILTIIRTKCCINPGDCSALKYANQNKQQITRLSKEHR
jgi:Na+-translocating ferredoxin:NAD+ oxidoreductase RnfC subunit